MTTATTERLSAPIAPVINHEDEEQQRYDAAFQEIIAADAAYIARHAAVEPTPETEAQPAPAAEPERYSLNDRVWRVVSGIQATLAVRRNKIANKWETMPQWQQRVYKTGAFLTSAAGFSLALQAYRITGAAAADISIVPDTSSLHTGFMPAAHPPANTNHGVLMETALALAPADRGQQLRQLSPIHTAYESNFLLADTSSDLPADLNKAPDPTALGSWDRNTGGGTIWGQTVAYADKLGYSNLTEHQKWELTDHVLRENNLSWDNARHLSTDFKPKMPSQNSMLTDMNELNAPRTHAPDRATVIAPDGGNTVNGPDVNGSKEPSTPITTDGTHTTTTPESTDTPNAFEAWMQKHWDSFRPTDAAWWERNSLNIAVIGGIVILGAVAARGLQHNRQQSVAVVPVSTTDPTAERAATLADPNDEDDDGDRVNPPKRRHKLFRTISKIALVAEGLAWLRRRRKRRARADNES